MTTTFRDNAGPSDPVPRSLRMINLTGEDISVMGITTPEGGARAVLPSAGLATCGEDIPEPMSGIGYVVSPALGQAMTDAGVLDRPDVFFGDTQCDFWGRRGDLAIRWSPTDPRRRNIIDGVDPMRRVGDPPRTGRVWGQAT